MQQGNKRDVAVFYYETGEWVINGAYIGKTMIKQVFGNKWDIPVPDDYNGDGKAQLATFTPHTGTWHIKGIGDTKFGTIGDVPLVRGK